MDNKALITLTADIASAHVSNNKVDPAEMPRLIEQIYGAMAGLGEPPVVEEPARTPAVPIRSSIKPEAITCLECGARMKMLKRHLATEHKLTTAEYRARWKLASDYPLVAPDYAARRSELAAKIGLGRKRKNVGNGGGEDQASGVRETGTGE